MNRDKNYKKKVQSNKVNVLDDETLAFYINVAKSIENNNNVEDREMFISGILGQMSTEALKISREGTVSKLVEKLIKHANIKQFRDILENFSKDWETACSDRFASFVTQTLVRQSSKFFSDVTNLNTASNSSNNNNGSNNSNNITDVNELKKLQKDILRMMVDGMIAFLFTNLAFFMQHFSVSHVVRASIEMLAGVKVDDDVVCGRKKMDGRDKQAPLTMLPMCEEVKITFQKVLLMVCQSVVALPKLEDHVCNNLSNPVLQTIILSYKCLPSDVSSNILNDLLTNTKVFHKQNESSNLPGLCGHEVASRFVEQVLMAVPDDLFDKIYFDYFKGSLLHMATSPIACFVLQKLIFHSRNIEQFESIYCEIRPHFESILALKHVEVIVKISEGCVKHLCKQQKFLKHISKAFHCYKPVERRCKLVHLLLSFVTYDIYYKIPQENEDDDDDGGKIKAETKNEKRIDNDNDDDDESDNDDDDDDNRCMPKLQSIDIYGSMIVQNMLQFENTSTIVSSLFEMSKEDWKMLCKDACGCRIVEAFIKSKTVPEKSKESLFGKLAGSYLELACDKWGSRSFDALWLNAKSKEKNFILEELNKNPNKLRSDKFGFFIYNKCLGTNQKRRPTEGNKQPVKKMRNAF